MTLAIGLADDGEIGGGHDRGQPLVRAVGLALAPDVAEDEDDARDRAPRVVDGRAAVGDRDLPSVAGRAAACGWRGPRRGRRRITRRTGLSTGGAAGFVDDPEHLFHGPPDGLRARPARQVLRRRDSGTSPGPGGRSRGRRRRCCAASCSAAPGSGGPPPRRARGRAGLDAPRRRVQPGARAARRRRSGRPRSAGRAACRAPSERWASSRRSSSRISDAVSRIRFMASLPNPASTVRSAAVVSPLSWSRIVDAISSSFALARSSSSCRRACCAGLSAGQLPQPREVLRDGADRRLVGLEERRDSGEQVSPLSRLGVRQRRKRRLDLADDRPRVLDRVRFLDQVARVLANDPSENEHAERDEHRHRERSSKAGREGLVHGVRSLSQPPRPGNRTSAAGEGRVVTP